MLAPDGGGIGAGAGESAGGGTTIPGGYQLPFEHVPPPNEMNGSGIPHGAPVFGIGVVGPGAGPMPGGYQLPFTHVPPPRTTKGSGIVQVPGPSPGEGNRTEGSDGSAPAGQT